MYQINFMAHAVSKVFIKSFRKYYSEYFKVNNNNEPNPTSDIYKDF